jgi:hypothetical protein
MDIKAKVPRPKSKAEEGLKTIRTLDTSGQFKKIDARKLWTNNSFLYSQLLIYQAYEKTGAFDALLKVVNGSNDEEWKGFCNHMVGVMRTSEEPTLVAELFSFFSILMAYYINDLEGIGFKGKLWK